MHAVLLLQQRHRAVYKMQKTEVDKVEIQRPKDLACQNWY
jgi:hypothetical protein